MKAKVSDKELAEIEEQGELGSTGSKVGDRQEAYESGQLDIIMPTEAERKQAEIEANDPKYDVYDSDDEWDG